MKILVTGASGYIGSWLVPALAQAGHEVTAVVRNGAAAPARASRVVVTSLADARWTDSLPDGIDVVAHLAQSRMHRRFPDGVPDMMRVNIDATVELLEWARMSGVKGIVLASSGNVYGAKSEPLSEDDPCRPVGFYGATRLSTELLAEPYAAYFGLVMPRIFGVYGPGQRGMTVANIIERIATGRAVDLASGAGLYFTPLYISDCVSALQILLERCAAMPATRFNVAGSEHTDLGTLVGMIERMLGMRAVTTESAEPARVLLGDASAFRVATGWKPAVSLADGISRTLAGWDLLQQSQDSVSLS